MGLLSTVRQSNFAHTFGMRALGFLKIRLLFLCSPSVVSLDENRVEIKLPLNLMTKNHLGSMYFGALAVGADCAGGYLAWSLIEKSGKKVSLVFKDFKAVFLKRADGDVHFTCEDGPGISDLVKRTLSSSDRQEMTVRVTATVPRKYGAEPVAQFELTLSLKSK